MSTACNVVLRSIINSLFSSIFYFKRGQGQFGGQGQGQGQFGGQGQGQGQGRESEKQREINDRLKQLESDRRSFGNGVQREGGGMGAGGMGGMSGGMGGGMGGMSGGMGGGMSGGMGGMGGGMSGGMSGGMGGGMVYNAQQGMGTSGGFGVQGNPSNRMMSMSNDPRRSSY